MGNNEDRIVNNFFNGNYEDFKKHLIENGIKDVYKDLELNIRNKKFFLTHNPINYKKGYINLVGHSHRSKGLWYSFGLSVSCDLNHYRPFSEDSLFFQLKRERPLLSAQSSQPRRLGLRRGRDLRLRQDRR